MSDVNDEEKQEEPLDPAVERIQHKLRRLLFGSTLIMFLGFAAVLAAIVYKINEGSDTEEAYRIPTVVTDESLRRAQYPIPEGARVVSTVISDGQLVVTYEVDGTGSTILVIDMASWQVFSVMELPYRR